MIDSKQMSNLDLEVDHLTITQCCGCVVEKEQATEVTKRVRDSHHRHLRPVH